MFSQRIGLFLLLISFSVSGFSTTNGDLIGNWWTKDKKAKVEMFLCGKRICGKIVWLKEPTYPQDDEEGMAGEVKVDRYNPDQSKRRDPVIGLQIVNGLKLEDGEWADGEIYDPKNGKTYNCKASLEGKDKLNLRGYIGFSLFGRTSSWQRVVE